MMSRLKNTYILHGCCDRAEFEDRSIPSGSNFHWIPWLQKMLLVDGYNVQTPEMPTPHKPSYQTWKSIFSTFPIDGQTQLVGHSCGGGFLLKYLGEHQIKLDKLVLVAPWLDPGKQLGDFLKCDLKEDLSKRINEIHIMYSEDEPVDSVKETVDIIMDTYPSAKLHRFNTHGHFCLANMGTQEFPELYEILR